MSAIIEVESLRKHFAIEQGLLKRSHSAIKAVDGVSFAIQPGETLCLVGESGCGKSTVGTLLMRGEMRPHRRRLQMVFQDPYASLNPRLTAGQIVMEPLENYSDFSRKERAERAAGLFATVGLRNDAMPRYPS